MATITSLPHPGKSLTYYATWHGQEGTAEQLNSTAYLFRLDGARSGRVVSAADPALVLAGRRDLADAQRAADGNLAALVCGYR